jgi:hypothetical protein
MRQQQLAVLLKPHHLSKDDNGNDNDNDIGTNKKPNKGTNKEQHVFVFVPVETVSYFRLASFFVMLSHA